MEHKNLFADVFVAIRNGLARSVSRIVPPREVEDIVQEAYVRLCQIDRQAEIREPKAFLYTTVRNLALDHVKRAESRLAISVEEVQEGQLRRPSESLDQTFDIAVSNEEFALFCKAVRELPLQSRRAFVLKKVYGYSLRQIAHEMSISESTVANHIATGMKRCTYFMLRETSESPAGAKTVSQGNRKRDSLRGQ